MECLSWNDARFRVDFSVNKKQAFYLDQAVQSESVQAKSFSKLDAHNGFSQAPAAAGGQKALGNGGPPLAGRICDISRVPIVEKLGQIEKAIELREKMEEFSEEVGE